jgi:hypothetical protein
MNSPPSTASPAIQSMTHETIGIASTHSTTPAINRGTGFSTSARTKIPTTQRAAESHLNPTSNQYVQL